VKAGIGHTPVAFFRACPFVQFVAGEHLPAISRGVNLVLLQMTEGRVEQANHPIWKGRGKKKKK
jgi:hypothetical protein